VLTGRRVLIVDDRSTESRPRLVAAHPLRLLLAEDNPVNRRWVTAILERHGHVVKAVENGRLAVDATRSTAFDAALMDVQMPEMDGLEATGIIRRDERTTGRHLPIIALTAHGTECDRQVSLANGMDGYLTKPLRSKVLLTLLAELTDADHPTGRATPQDDRPEALLSCVNGDHDLLVELTGLLRESAPAVLAAIREGVIAGDAKSIERAAHRLRGSISHFGASAAVRTAMTLERMGRNGDVRDSLSQCEQLEDQLQDLLGHLDRATQSVAV
ncbi:MAG: response regulator, partial [Vicinamibacterales bacterium]